MVVSPVTAEELNLITHASRLLELRRGRLQFKILDHGYLKYIDHLGSDEDIVRAARMSTQKGFLGWYWEEDGVDENGKPHKKGDPRDLNFLEFLWANKHASPFEQGELVFEIKAPIMVFREWHRHRTQMFNEMSGRYVQMPNEHYVPEPERIQKQSNTNKQGSGEAMNLAEALEIAAELTAEQQDTYQFYDELVARGVAKEVARIDTPISRYSVMRAKANVRNWLHFFSLRLPASAQWEIRQYAEAGAVVLNEFFPKTYYLFEEYTLHGTSLSRTETELLRFVIKSYHDNAGSIPSELLKELEKKLGERKTKDFWKKLGL